LSATSKASSGCRSALPNTPRLCRAVGQTLLLADDAKLLAGGQAVVPRGFHNSFDGSVPPGANKRSSKGQACNGAAKVALGIKHKRC
jgi:hypothetical protein